jgi:hypothetical protein
MGEMEKDDEELAALIIAKLMQLPPGDRRTDVLDKVHDRICKFCGYEHPKGHQCQCWNDE